MDELAIRPATREDCFDIGHRLRPDDYLELRHTFGADADPGWTLDSLRLAQPASTHTLYIGGERCAIGGCPESRPGIGVPWLIGTDHITKNRFTFHYLAKKVLEHWRVEYDFLSNVVWKGSGSVRWLKRLGFQVDSEISHVTPSGGEFVRFSMIGENSKCVPHNSPSLQSKQVGK